MPEIIIFPKILISFKNLTYDCIFEHTARYLLMYKRAGDYVREWKVFWYISIKDNL